jgi:Fur family ferric uptake transcriptional regulator
VAGDSNVRHDDAHIRLERRCVERGVRLTHQRRIIARILSEADDHPDVEELYRRAMIGDGSLSIATVYRTVRLLEKNGVIDRHTFVGTRARYEASNDARRHHLVDIETGKAAAFEDDTLQRQFSRP